MEEAIGVNIGLHRVGSRRAWAIFLLFDSDRHGPALVILLEPVLTC